MQGVVFSIGAVSAAAAGRDAGRRAIGSVCLISPVCLKRAAGSGEGHSEPRERKDAAENGKKGAPYTMRASPPKGKEGQILEQHTTADETKTGLYRPKTAGGSCIHGGRGRGKSERRERPQGRETGQAGESPRPPGRGPAAGGNDAHSAPRGSGGGGAPTGPNRRRGGGNNKPKARHTGRRSEHGHRAAAIGGRTDHGGPTPPDHLSPKHRPPYRAGGHRASGPASGAHPTAAPETGRLRRGRTGPGGAHRGPRRSLRRLAATTGPQGLRAEAGLPMTDQTSLRARSSRRAIRRERSASDRRRGPIGRDAVGWLLLRRALPCMPILHGPCDRPEGGRETRKRGAHALRQISGVSRLL